MIHKLVLSKFIVLNFKEIIIIANAMYLNILNLKKFVQLNFERLKLGLILLHFLKYIINNISY